MEFQYNDDSARGCWSKFTNIKRTLHAPSPEGERALSLLWTITTTYLCLTSRRIHEISPMYAMCHYTAFVCDILLGLIFIYVAACITGPGLCVRAGSP